MAREGVLLPDRTNLCSTSRMILTESLQSHASRVTCYLEKLLTPTGLSQDHILQNDNNIDYCTTIEKRISLK